MIDQDCDITTITETWLSEEEARSEQNVKYMFAKCHTSHTLLSIMVVLWVYYIKATSTSGNLTQRPLNHLNMMSYF